MSVNQNICCWYSKPSRRGNSFEHQNSYLTLKVPITTAADDKFCDIFPSFQHKYGMIYDSHEISCHICYFCKSSEMKIVVCCKLWVKWLDNFTLRTLVYQDLCGGEIYFVGAKARAA